MRTENKEMKKYLKTNGIDAMPKYLHEGSLKGCWRLYNSKVNWWENYELMGKLHNLGFRDYDGKPFTNFSGNGGRFSIFARKIS